METKTTQVDHERVAVIVNETLAAGTPGLPPLVEHDSGAVTCDETNSFRRSYTYIAGTGQPGAPLDAAAVVERIRTHWRARGFTWREAQTGATADGTPKLSMTTEDGFSVAASVPEGGHKLSVTGQSPCK